LTIFSDSQPAIQRTLNDKLGPGQALAIEIIAITEELKEKGVLTIIRWVLSHFGIKGNEKADLLAKKAANQPKHTQIDDYSSFSYIQRLVQRQKVLDTQQWLFDTQKQRLKHHKEFQEKPISSLTTNRAIFQATKRLSSRFFQLKIGHAITATYLKRIQKLDNTRCWWCSERQQTVEHQFFNCKRWRKQRKKFFEEKVKLGLSKPRNKDKNDKNDKNKLFNNLHAYNAILAFLDAIDIGLRVNNNEREEQEIYNQDSWDLESLNSSRSSMKSN
jgi:hypothetical protein